VPGARRGANQSMLRAPYIHGTSPEEHVRLGHMNQLLNARELDAIGLAGDERVLELGAGTGLFARALAERLPRGRLLAIELDARQLAAARANTAGLTNVELRQGDACAPPLAAGEPGSFDLVHARFLLEHLSEPAAAVRAMAGAVRPGGRVVLVDDDHDTLRLWPAAPAFERLWRAYCEQYSLRGTDPWIGRRLTGLLSEAGLRPADATLLFFGACAGMELFPLVIANMLGVVAGAAEDIALARTLSTVEIEDGLSELRRWSERADAALWYAVPYAAAVRPT
jgi:SAM-dependent methyltransferase